MPAGDYPVNQQPCRTCGTCPTCGNRPSVSPPSFVPDWTYRPQPYVPAPWIYPHGVAPQITWGRTWTSGNTTYDPNATTIIGGQFGNATAQAPDIQGTIIS